MTRVGGGVLIAGGAMGALVVLVTEGPRLRTGLVLTVSGLTFLLAFAYLAAGDRVPDLLLYAGPPAGSALVATMIYLGGGGVTSAALAMPYVWIAMYTGYFHSVPYLTMMLACGAVGHAVALSLLGSGTWASVWTYAAGTSIVAGGMVSYLVARLRSLAETDALTGLPNRRSWDERLTHHLTLADRLGYPLCVVMMDVDGFKRLNDSEGHAAGDAVLQTIAEDGNEVLRGTDVFARVGGDEFAMLLPGCDLESAGDIVRRMRSSMEARVTMSAGVASWDGEETAEALLGRADAALYRAKELGRDRVELAGAPAQDALLEPSVCST